MLITLISIVFGGIWAWIVLGKNLFPWQVDGWENTINDPAQHYNSWLLFASDSFSFTLTFTKKIGYPIGTSIVYGDTIPLFAILFKPIYKIVNQDFQYFGIYFWVASSLTFYFTFRLLNKILQAPYYIKLLISTLVMTSPISVFRITGHEALSAHWVIIACFYLFLIAEEVNLFRLNFYLFLLFFISTGLHAYLASFVILTLIGISVVKLIKQDQRAVLVLSLNGLFLFPLSLFFWGYTVGSGGGKLWSANLLSLFDSQSRSRFVPALSYTRELGFQYEGFSYLGTG